MWHNVAYTEIQLSFVLPKIAMVLAEYEHFQLVIYKVAERCRNLPLYLITSALQADMPLVTVLLRQMAGCAVILQKHRNLRRDYEGVNIRHEHPAGEVALLAAS
jgi:hypothetical protein